MRYKARGWILPLILLSPFTRAQSAVPPLAEILAASEYLSDGDIPVDSSTAVGKTPLYVATDGSDENDGLSPGSPKRHLGAALTYANANPGTPFVIYLRGGTHYRQSAYEYLEIKRGSLMITAYPGETVTIRPDFWPANPASWGEQVFLYAYGGHSDITISNLALEGWDTPFMFGADWAYPAMRDIVFKNITAREFRPRFTLALIAFFSTNYVQRDFFPGGATTFDPAAPGIKYQIEGLILSDITLEGVGMGVNIGDENDANVRGLRISELEIRNDPQGGGNSATDGVAVVNCENVLIDHCTIDHISDDGIDCKAFDVCVVNSYVHGTGRNGVKFWRNGEFVNSIVYDCTPINDGAFIIEAGPFRIVHSVLMRKSPGYAGTFHYGGTSTESFEIVNSVFSDLDHTFYVGTGDLRSKNTLYHDMPGGLFSGQVSASNVSQLNALPACADNIEGNPDFANPAGEDFTPSSGSPCVDGGTQAGVLLPSFDFYGNPRIHGGAPDIGPVERRPSADLNGDGQVTVRDLGILMSFWSTAEAACDLDGSGTVGPGDLAALLAEWTG